MNAYQAHQRKTSRALRLIAAVLLAGCASAAVAQDAPQGNFNLAVPAQQSAGPVAVAPGVAAEPEYKLPADASISTSNEEVQKLATENQKRLDEVVGGAFSNEREKNDVDELAKQARVKMRLENDLENAKLVKETHKVIYGDDNKSKEELEKTKTERDELAAQVKSLEDQLVDTNKNLQAQSQNQPQQGRPVIVSIEGVNGRLSAKLLVPAYGEAVVKTGDTLANGQKVVSITAQGVKVRGEDGPITLAFGTSVPR
jgi:type IV pilus biogenesis protein PilP